MKKVLTIIIVVLAVLILATAGVIYQFYIPNNNMAQAYDRSKLNLVVEGELVASKNAPKIVDEEILLPFDVVKKYFDPNIYWDDKLKKVTITTRDRVIRMKTDSLNALVNNKPVTLRIPVSVENGAVYIPIEFLSDFYNIEISYLKDNNIIVIDFRNSLRQLAQPITEGAVVRLGRSIHEPVVKKLDPSPDKADDNTLRVFEEYDKWYKVRTSDGSIGYIEKKFVVVKRLMVKKVPEEQQASSTAWKPEKGRISLVWDAIYTGRPDFSKMTGMDGLDVISPTWFQVLNEKGDLINRADAKYVEWAHKSGYKVWALFSNDFKSPSMTQQVLNNTDVRDNIIRQLLAYSSLYKLDGINIDFENINKEDRDALTQFVREAAPLLKQQGLVVSIDVTVPEGSGNWSLCYDRKALGQVVDYVMLMTYDQHWSTSPESGSVAQVTWVEQNVKKVVSMIPGEKLLLGLPFYTRLWKEEKGADGKVKVSNPKALSMQDAKKLVKENNARVVWDETSGQFYSEYKSGDATYKIWLEDENSINLKSALVQKYRLAGAAAWRRSDAMPEVWNVLDRNLKSIDNYQDWLAINKNRKYSYE